MHPCVYAPVTSALRPHASGNFAPVEPSCAFTSPRRVRLGEFSWQTPTAIVSFAFGASFCDESPECPEPTVAKRSRVLAPMPNKVSAIMCTFHIFSCAVLQNGDQISIQLFNKFDDRLLRRCACWRFIVRIIAAFDGLRRFLPTGFVFGAESPPAGAARPMLSPRRAMSVKPTL